MFTQTLQNNAIRTILGISRHTSVRSIVKQKRLLDIRGLAKSEVALLMFKHIKGYSKLKFLTTQPLPPSGYSLRSNREGCLSLFIPKTTIREHSPGFVFLDIWNRLPLELKERKTISMFKKHLHEHLLQNQ